MNEVEIKLLSEINEKINTLISLLKIGFSDNIESFRTEVNKNKIYKIILSLSEGTIPSGQLFIKTKEMTGISESTYKRHISYLLENGLLIRRRVGREFYYINTGIVDI